MKARSGERDGLKYKEVFISMGPMEIGVVLYKNREDMIKALNFDKWPIDSKNPPSAYCGLGQCDKKPFAIVYLNAKDITREIIIHEFTHVAVSYIGYMAFKKIIKESAFYKKSHVLRLASGAEETFSHVVARLLSLYDEVIWK